MHDSRCVPIMIEPVLEEVAEIAETIVESLLERKKEQELG